MKSASSGLTFLKGLGIAVGGILLGFFGCLGGLQANNGTVTIGALVVGGLVLVGGVIMMLVGVFRALTGSGSSGDQSDPTKR